MEISLEKIELVKDRTGVSYREAKEALIAENGSVVDAIIRIEDQIDIAPKTAAENAASDIVGKIKDVVKKGNVSKVVIRKDDSVVLSIPVTLGVIGSVLLPEAAIISTILALGVKCSISVITKDGEEVDVVQKAKDKISDAKDNYSSVAEGIKEKGSDAFSKIKEKADNVISKRVQENGNIIDDDYFNFDDEDPDPQEPVISSESADLIPDKEELAEAGEKIADTVTEAVEEAAETVEQAADEAKDAAADLLDEAEGLADDAADKFDATISDFKARRKRFFK